ncbi:MAG: radical SAM protein [Chloroflexi bacterium]|nr:radical SAM protein [Chloroflexota bacterium]
MATVTQKRSIRGRLWDSVRADFSDLLNVYRPIEKAPSGLYAYNIVLPNEGTLRIHLRIEEGGQGVIFVDVTDVVHLNPSAAMIAKMALEDIPMQVARARIHAKYTGVRNGRLSSDLANIYEMIDQFRNPNGECPTCLLDGSLEKSPLFSIDVNAPYKVDIALTYGCNNECPHCYNEVDRLPMASLPLHEWKIVLDNIAARGVPHVILTGGEATLHPDLAEIINYADQLGMIVGLNTNGRHIAHKPYMENLANSGLNHVQITLGSNYPEIHDAVMGAKSFTQTVRGIENAIASKVYVITNTTLMRNNMDHVEEILDFIYDLGIRTFAMNGMIYSGGGFSHPFAIHEKEMPALLARVRDLALERGMRFLWYTPTEYCRMSPIELEIGAKRCNAGEYSFCIEPNGDVLPCQSYYVSAGNILNDTWEQIWGGELFRSFRDRETDPQMAGLPEKCWNCPDLALCGAGCRIEREAREGNRVSTGAGGGCIGCSGSFDTSRIAKVEISDPLPTANLSSDGFVPNASMTNTTLRSSGNMPIITLEEVGK